MRKKNSFSLALTWTKSLRTHFPDTNASGMVCIEEQLWIQLYSALCFKVVFVPLQLWIYHIFIFFPNLTNKTGKKNKFCFIFLPLFSYLPNTPQAFPISLGISILWALVFKNFYPESRHFGLVASSPLAGGERKRQSRERERDRGWVERGRRQ